jgi:hypothetical protein
MFENRDSRKNRASNIHGKFAVAVAAVEDERCGSDCCYARQLGRMGGRLAENTAVVIESWPRHF